MAQAAAPAIRDAIEHAKEGGGAFSIEKFILDNYVNGGDRDGRRKFLALHWYLQDVLYEVSENYAIHADNFDRLISALRNLGRPLAFITLNYDVILDRKLEDYRHQAFTSLDDYVVDREGIRLFKLHGSINWGHPIYSDAPLHDVTRLTPADLRFDAETYVLASTDPVAVVNRGPSVDDLRIGAIVEGQRITPFKLFPALSVPLGDANDVSCPATHVDTLRKVVADCEAIDLLTIGYSGLDQQAV